MQTTTVPPAPRGHVRPRLASEGLSCAKCGTRVADTSHRALARLVAETVCAPCNRPAYFATLRAALT